MAEPNYTLKLTLAEANEVREAAVERKTKLEAKWFASQLPDAEPMTAAERDELSGHLDRLATLISRL